MGEKPDVLYGISDGPTKPLRLNLAGILTINEDTPGGRLDKAINHPQGSGLTTARRANQYAGIPLVNPERKLIDSEIIRIILGHVFKTNQP
jgi:hypothetical protein